MGAVVLLSGGIDSATCLAVAIKQVGKENVKALTFDYGQKHENELLNAKAVARRMDVELIIAKIDSKIFEHSNSTLLKGNGAIAHERYGEEGNDKVADTYVPFRNGLMLSQAAALAYKEDEVSDIVYGAHKDDAAGSAYPDCSNEFYQVMDLAIQAGTAGRVKLHAPFINKTKAQVVATGIELGVPYELTRSCYEGRNYACGKCATCIDRIEAFKQARMKDPVPYEIAIDWSDSVYGE